ncbi:MAG: carboxypeptidase regulatory-like domain-containing protein [Armatimonadetes bacterium]|nr:carboxypeptidase regulatory-like domain-containing protein [Armatimonadota bacterium]
MKMHPSSIDRRHTDPKDGIASPVVLVLVVLILTALCTVDARAQVPPTQIVVVYGNQLPYNSGSRPEQLAATEMQEYIQQMTGTWVQVVSDAQYTAFPGTKTGVVLIGRPEANSVVQNLQAAGKVDVTGRMPASEDGFVIISAADAGKDYLILAGNGTRANFYAVYRYLEKYCSVGFFQDGDRVPSASGITFDNILLVDQPRLPMRANRGGGAQAVDWLLKKGYNHVFTEMVSFLQSTEVVQGAFPEVNLGVSPPTSFNFPDRDYCRARGLKFYVQSGPINWGVTFRAWHDAFWNSEAFGPLLASERARLGETEYWTPKNEMFRIFHQRMYSYIISNYYGMDMQDTYWISYAVEDLSLKPYDAIGVSKGYEALHAADPGVTILYDCWHMLTYNYTPAEYQAWDQVVPKEVGMADSGAYGGGLFGTYGQFPGRKWVLDFIYLLGPTNQLQAVPNLGYYKNLLCYAAADPDFLGNLCRPEAQMTNMLLEDWFSRLFWDPFTADEQQYLEDYVVHRYGEQSKTNMLASVKEAARAMSYGKPSEYYILVSGFNSPMSYPIMMFLWDDDDIRRGRLGADMLERALESALAERAAQSGNALYDLYLEEVFRTYCMRLYHLALLRLSEAWYSVLFQGGGQAARDKFEAEALKLSRICTFMAQGLSADPRYSLYYMAYPGSPNSLDGIFTDCYWCNVYYPEIIRLKYRMVTEAMVGWFRDRMNSGNRNLPTVWEMSPALQPARDAALAAAKAEFAAYTPPTQWPPISGVVSNAFNSLKALGCGFSSFASTFERPRKQGWMLCSNNGRAPSYTVGAPEPIYSTIDSYGRSDYLYDFGPGMMVLDDFHQALPKTAYSPETGYGWLDTTGLDGWDSGYPDDLHGDFVYGTSPHTFKVDLPNGQYNVLVFGRHTGFEMGYQRHGHYVSEPSELRVSVLGTTQATISARYEAYSPGFSFPAQLTLGDQFKQQSFVTNVTNGQLELTFSGNGSTAWAISGLMIIPVSAQPRSVPPVVNITGPTSESQYYISQPSVNLSGAVTEAYGVASVTWSNAANGQSGNCALTGPDTWSADGVALVSGPNQITVTAVDLDGYTGSDAITVNRVESVIQGKVTRDVDGSMPIVGATIIVTGTAVSATTGSDGTYILALGTGNHTLWVSASGFCPAQDFVMTSSGQTVQKDFVLNPKASWNIREEYSSTNNPSGVWKYGYRASATGAFTLMSPWTNAPPGWTDGWKAPVGDFCSITPRPGGLIGIHPGSGGELAIVRFTAQQTGTYAIDGYFQGESSYVPLPDSTTFIKHVGAGGSTTLYTVDCYGTTQNPFALSRFCSAGERIEFMVNYGPDLDYNNDSTIVEAEIKRLEGGSIRGRVIANTLGSEPIPGATVKIVDTSIQSITRDNGSYGLPISAGTYTFEASCPGFQTVTVGPVTAPPGEQTIIDITVPASAVHGVVCGDPTGIPLIAGATVTTAGRPTVTTGADGSYSIVVPPGMISITASADGYTPKTTSVTTPPGETKTLNFVLRPGGYWLAGREYSLQNNPSGVWSYGYRTSWPDPFTLMTEHGIFGWVASIPGDYLTIGAGYSADIVKMHPGKTGGVAVVRFAAPQTGVYTIQGSFGGENQWTSSTAYVKHTRPSSSATLFSTDCTGTTGSSFYLTRACSAGEFIDFAVDYGPNLDYNSDATNLTATITLVPPSNPPMSVSSIKALIDDASVTTNDVVVTADFGDTFYVEETDRSSGIRVYMPGNGVWPDWKVKVIGTLKTDPANEERYIEGNTAEYRGMGSVGPVGLSNRALGGGPFGRQVGATGVTGPNTIGLLVTVWGKLTKVGTNRYSLSDGSGVDVTVSTTAPITVPGSDPPVEVSDGAFVVVTGASSCEKSGGIISRLIRAVNVTVMTSSNL